ncbi:MAG: CRISPR-associated primase-polymerase type B [Paludibacteraceae bacterium]|nr:CRISPR-associated primase-polymerase type B [Paludibacteraceae bacterium]
MINAGTNIRAVDDALKKVKVEYLYHSIRNPRPEIVSQIRQLRILQEIDHSQYVAQKRTLPYVVCGMFNPPYRRTENFAYAEYFIVDIDHITEKGLEIESLRRKIEADQRVVLSFLSPSEDGLKVMFRLKERCCDSGLYAIFYKAFVTSFSKLYCIEQVVDAKTSDVTRACFISVDEKVYYNPNAERVDLQAFVDLSNTFALFEQKREIERYQKEIKPNTPEEKAPIDPGDETMHRIKEILNPRAAKREEKRVVFVPGILEDIIFDLKNYIEKTGAVVSSIVSIQYGKQIMVKVGLKLAEVNLFYGKHGFRVVRSTKSGTDSDVTEVIAQLVETFIDTYDQLQHE